MTTQQRRQLFTGIVGTLLSGALIFGFGAAWSTKEDRSTADTRAYVARAERDTLKMMLQRVDARTARTDSAVKRMERFLCRNRPEDLGC